MTIEERIAQIENTDNVEYGIRNNLCVLCEDLVNWLKSKDYSKEYVPFDACEFQAHRSLMCVILDKLKAPKDTVKKESDEVIEIEHKQVLRALYFYGIFGTHEFYNNATLVSEGHNIMSYALKTGDIPYKAICIDRINSDFISEKLKYQSFPMNAHLIFNGASEILAVKMYKEFNGVAA